MLFCSIICPTSHTVYLCPSLFASSLSCSGQQQDSRTNHLRKSIGHTFGLYLKILCTAQQRTDWEKLTTTRKVPAAHSSCQCTMHELVNLGGWTHILQGLYRLAEICAVSIDFALMNTTWKYLSVLFTKELNISKTFKGHAVIDKIFHLSNKQLSLQLQKLSKVVSVVSVPSSSPKEEEKREKDAIKIIKISRFYCLHMANFARAYPQDFEKYVTEVNSLHRGFKTLPLRILHLRPARSSTLIRSGILHGQIKQMLDSILLPTFLHQLCHSYVFPSFFFFFSFFFISSFSFNGV